MIVIENIGRKFIKALIGLIIGKIKKR